MGVKMPCDWVKSHSATGSGDAKVPALACIEVGDSSIVDASKACLKQCWLRIRRVVMRRIQKSDRRRFGQGEEVDVVPNLSR